MKRTLFFLLFIPIAFSQAQVNVDSLWGVYNDPKEGDTARLSALKRIAWEGFLFSNPDTSFYFATLQRDLAREVGNQMMEGSALMTMGATHYIKGEMVEAIEYYKKSLAIVKEIGDARGISATLNNIGAIYYSKGAYDKAIEYYTESLKMDEKTFEESGDNKSRKGISIAYNNIGNIYWAQEEFEKSGGYYQKSLDISEEIGFEHGIAAGCNNLGLYYSETGNDQKAMEYYQRCKEISLKVGDLEKEADARNGIAGIYARQSRDIEALKEYEKCLELRVQAQDRVAQAGAHINLSSQLKSMGRINEALIQGQKGLRLAEETEGLEEQRDATKNLYSIYQGSGDFKAALKMHEQYLILKDSLRREENQREILNQEFKYQYEKKEAIANAQHQAELDHEKELAHAHEQKQNIIIASISFGLILVLIFSGFLYNRFKLTSRQKGIIEEQKADVESQKKLVEEKNQQITDSIQYAKRIQGAILPPLKLVKNSFEDSFILYQPKDIVAGDFYWMAQIDDANKAGCLFAAADCTGHGVPGALVSVVCNNSLNRAVREFGLTDPGEILDKTRELVIEEFERSEEEVQDGMDIALCSLSGTDLKYAGAHNPLWILPKDSQDLVEVKANKQPIGIYEKTEGYNTHALSLNKGDSIFIFSDGIVDQFGGPKGKKFMASRFKRLLISIKEKGMEEQGKLIAESFEEWKGSNPQLDDVCVIGVRI